MEIIQKRYLVSSSAITDILYVLRRAVKDRNLVREKYESFRKKISILPVTEKDIDTAFARDWKDFEDAVQYTVAESNGVDCTSHETRVILRKTRFHATARRRF